MTDALADRLAAGPVRWLLTGDSITQGWGLADPATGYAQRFTEHLRRHAGPVRSRDTVTNTGLAGATVGETLHDASARLDHPADVALILFGMNDAARGTAGLAEFRGGMADLVALLERRGAIPVLQTPYPVGDGDGGSHDALPAYVDAVRALAAEAGAPLVDHAAHWEQLSERQDWYTDPWHVDDRGHAHLARLLIDTLLHTGR